MGAGLICGSVEAMAAEPHLYPVGAGLICGSVEASSHTYNLGGQILCVAIVCGSLYITLLLLLLLLF